MKLFKIPYLIIVVTIVSTCMWGNISHAQTVDELKSKIDAGNETIRKLEAEIKGYQGDIDALGKEKTTLTSTLKELDITKKKLEANTKITESKIATKNLEIKQLSLQIGDKNERITDGRRVISQSLRAIQANALSPLEVLLSSASMSQLWNTSYELTTLQGQMQGRIGELEDLKTDLEENKLLTEKKKTELVVLTNDLKNQAAVVRETVKEKNTLLAETKNTEADYKKLLASKLAQKQAFEREVSNLESTLKLTINPNSIPKTGSGVLKWPLEKIRVTQHFGTTAFSTANPSVYKGTGHNGIDFAAPVGTPVLAAASGIVTQVINSNTAQRCGYGKWIVIKHDNGLSTLYSHLSLPTVAKGETVTVGRTIGYSGNTGFTTGPHLHFGVYVTQGLQTIESKSCPGIIIPYAAYNAYLNPLSFL